MTARKIEVAQPQPCRTPSPSSPTVSVIEFSTATGTASREPPRSAAKNEARLTDWRVMNPVVRALVILALAVAVASCGGGASGEGVGASGANSSTGVPAVPSSPATMAHATHGTEERPEPEADADPVAAAQDRFAELEAALETTGWRLTCDPLFGPEQGPRAPDDPVAATHGYSYCATYTTSHDGVFFAAYRSAEAANAAAAVTEECGDRADEGT